MRTTQILVFCLPLHLTLRLVMNEDKRRKIMMSRRRAWCSELCSVTFRRALLFHMPFSRVFPLLSTFPWAYPFTSSLTFFLIRCLPYSCTRVFSLSSFLIILFYIFSVPWSPLPLLFFLPPDIHQGWYLSWFGVCYSKMERTEWLIPMTTHFLYTLAQVKIHTSGSLLSWDRTGYPKCLPSIAPSKECYCRPCLMICPMADRTERSSEGTIHM